MLEQPYVSIKSLVDDLAPLISRQSALPFAFFGHSLGGLLAFEMTRHLARHGLPMPLHLFASGCDAPQFRSDLNNIHLLPHDEMVEALRKYNGTPPEVLEHRELMELVLPTIRADFQMVADYQYVTDELLSLPITVLAGRQEPDLLPEQVDGWAKETTGPFAVQWYEGDHFFIVPQQANVLAHLRRVLRGYDDAVIA